MKKIKKLSVKILLFTLLPIIIIFTIIGVLISINIFNSERQNAFDMANQIQNNYANQLSIALNNKITVQRLLQHIFEGYEDKPVQDRRPQYQIQILQLLEKQSDIIGIWTGWEPNSIDTLDSTYQGTDWYDSTGRFIPYYYRNESGEIKLEQLIDYEVNGSGDYYLLQRNTGKEVIIDPFYYQLGSKNVLMTSLQVPIRNKKNIVVGVVGVNISLDILQDIVSKIKPYNTGVQALFSNNGTVQAHFDSSRLGKDGKITEYSMTGNYTNSFFNSIEAGKTHSLTVYSEDLKSDLYILNVPLFIGSSEHPWSLQVGIPMNQVLQKQYSILYTMIIIFIGAAVILTIIVVIIAKNIVTPIKLITEDLQKISNKDLKINEEQNIIRQKYTKQEDETGKSLKNMDLTRIFLLDIFTNIRGIIKNLKNSSNTLLSSQNFQFEQIDKLMNKTEIVDRNTQTTQQQLEEVTSGVEEVQQSAQDVQKMQTELTEQNETTSKNQTNGEEMIREVIQKIETSKQQTKITMETVIELSKNMNNVSEIITTITSIQEQTNLLALNQAIEQARAGDAGRGFAVVADEIRKLAENSKESANNIKKIISIVQENTKQTEQATSKTSEIVDDVYVTINKVNEQFEKIIELFDNQQKVASGLTATAQEQGQSSEEMQSAVDNSQKNATQILGEIQDIVKELKLQLQESEKIKNQSNELENVQESLNKIISQFNL